MVLYAIGNLLEEKWKNKNLICSLAKIRKTKESRMNLKLVAKLQGQIGTYLKRKIKIKS
jgi:hypothetical protein